MKFFSPSRGRYVLLRYKILLVIIFNMDFIHWWLSTGLVPRAPIPALSRAQTDFRQNPSCINQLLSVVTKELVSKCTMYSAF